MKPTPPVLAGAPVVGNLFEFMKDRPGLLQKGFDTCGPIFAIKLVNQPVAVLIGPEYQQTFFTETDKKLSLHKTYAFLKAALGEVGFTAPPEIYLKQRPVMLQPFKSERMVKYLDIMQLEVQQWLDGLGEQGEIELRGEINQVVQNVAAHALMGKDFRERMQADFWKLYLILGQSLDPALPPYLPLPKFIRRDRAKKQLREMIWPLIAERRANPEKYDDFLLDFATARYKDGSPVEDETIVALIMGLMFAGHETTAGQAAWTIIQLLQHPDYLKLLQQEISDHLPLTVGIVGAGLSPAPTIPGPAPTIPGPAPTIPTVTPAPTIPTVTNQAINARTLSALKHVFWAVQETTRMHPSADSMIRRVEEEIEIGDYRIPKNWNLMLNAEVAQRIPSLFTEPEEYDPLRFAPGREEDRQHRFSIIGFGGGTHKCAGMNFANNEMMIIAALLFQQFDLELVTKKPQVDRSMGASRPERTIIRYTRKTHLQSNHAPADSAANTAHCPHMAATAEVCPAPEISHENIS